MTREEAIHFAECLKHNYTINFADMEIFCDMAIKALEQEPTTENDLALIHTEGLDEEIRCTMCTNSMKSDRGCDGSCVVDKDMYKAVLDVIEKRIQPTTKNDLAVDCISRAQAQTEIEMNASRYTIARERGGMGQVEWSDQLIKVSDAVDIIMNLPTAIPQEPKRGHWISHREHCENLGVMPSGLGAYEWCSNCDCGIDVREWHRNHYNFCPNCGADMREVEE